MKINGRRGNGWIGGRCSKEFLKEKLVATSHKTYDGCWERQVGIHPIYGYSYINVARKKWFAHRLSYTLFKGDIEPGLCVLHSCDNKRCVNPAHLFLGTQFDNLMDAKAKGRNGVGTKNSCAKLSDTDVACLRLMRAMGFGPKVLGQVFKIHRVHVYNVVMRKRRDRLTGVGAGVAPSQVALR